MENHDIARRLEEVADLLEISGANPFRIRAYRNAVHTVEAETAPLARRLEAGEDLTELPGIGKEMAGHIAELVESGELTVYKELTADIPPSLIDLVRLPGVGPKKARKVWEELGVTSVDELEAAAEAGRVADLSGFGKKSQQKILDGIRDFREHSARTRIDEADQRIAPLVERLRALPQVERLEVAGSYRRRKETVGDIDLLVVVGPGNEKGGKEEVMETFTGFPGIKAVSMSGPIRGSITLASGLQVDLRIVPPESYGAALVYFTGSKEHNVRLRIRGVERGLKINEYGVFRVEEGEEEESPGLRSGEPQSGIKIAGATEEEVYRAVELAWVPPELREDRGEIRAAAEGKLPELVTTADLKGDLQMHSTWSDGKASIEEMLIACAERGYEYFALTDHSKALAMTGGLDAVRIREQWKEIAEVQARHPEIRLLRSQEIDILADGSLDQDEDVLEELELVVVSIHSRFELSAAEQTRRVLRAVEHPRTHILAHPTGRLIGQRNPIALDLEEVLHACKEHRVAVELNAHPQRLDLKDTHLLLAKKLDVPVVISTDAHSPKGLGLMPYGVEQARRAWLTPADVLNTRPLAEFLAWVENRKD